MVIRIQWIWEHLSELSKAIKVRTLLYPGKKVSFIPFY